MLSISPQRNFTDLLPKKYPTDLLMQSPTPTQPFLMHCLNSCPCHQLPYILGSSSPRALRVTCLIIRHPVTVLVDCGNTHNLVQPRVAKFLNHHTTPIPTFGPFKILERIGKVAYRLELPPESLIHPVFHVSLLRPCYGESSPSVLTLPKMFIEDLLVMEPEAILDHRNATINNNIMPKVLLKWKNHDISEATWEPASEITLPTTSVDLEDKIPLNDRGVNRITTHVRPKRDTRRPARYPD